MTPFRAIDDARGEAENACAKSSWVGVVETMRGALVNPIGEFSVAVSHEPGDDVVTLAGEVDMMTAPQFAAAALPLGGPGMRLVFDLSAVTFMDSSGLSVIAATLQRLQRDGGTACVRGASPTIRRIVDISGLSQCDILDLT